MSKRLQYADGVVFVDAGIQPHVARMVNSENADHYGELFAAAPEMAEVLECMANMARHFPNIPTYGNRPRTGTIYTVADGQGEASITVEDLHRAAALLARIRGDAT